MKVTVRYPEQVKVGWRYSQMEVLKNGKRVEYLKKNKYLVMEVQEGDTVQAKIGLAKSDIVKIKEAEDYSIRISNFLRYDSIFFFLGIIINSIIVSFIPKELGAWFTYFGIVVAIMFTWAFYFMNGKHVFLEKTS